MGHIRDLKRRYAPFVGTRKSKRYDCNYSSSVIVHLSKLNIVVPAHSCGNKLKVVIIMLIQIVYRPLYSKQNIKERQMCVYARTLIVSRDSLFLNTSRLPAVTMSDGRALHIRVTSGKKLCL